MTYENKIEICKLRLDGKSIYQIATALNILPQSVNTFLKGLPESNELHPLRPQISDEEMLDICKEYIDGNPVKVIAEKKHLEEAEINKVFAFLKARKPPLFASEYYPAVTDWMKENGISIRAFSKAIGFSFPLVSNVLKGNNGAQMSFDMAASIKAYTGLAFSEIFRVQTQSITTAMKEE